MVYYAFSISRHEKVLEGLTISAEMKDNDRFDMIITGLGMRTNLPIQVGCMQLVNAIICTPQDHLDHRLHLRNEFMRCGLQNTIKVFDLNLNKITSMCKSKCEEHIEHRYYKIICYIKKLLKESFLGKYC